MFKAESIQPYASTKKGAIYNLYCTIMDKEKPQLQMCALNELMRILYQSKEAEVIESILDHFFLIITVERNVAPKVGHAAIKAIGEWGKSQNDSKNKILAMETVNAALEIKNIEPITTNMSKQDYAINAIMKITGSVKNTSMKTQIFERAHYYVDSFINDCLQHPWMNTLPHTISRATKALHVLEAQKRLIA